MSAKKQEETADIDALIAELRKLPAKERRDVLSTLTFDEITKVVLRANERSILAVCTLCGEPCRNCGGF